MSFISSVWRYFYCAFCLAFDAYGRIMVLQHEIIRSGNDAGKQGTREPVKIQLTQLKTILTSPSMGSTRIKYKWKLCEMKITRQITQCLRARFKIRI